MEIEILDTVKGNIKNQIPAKAFRLSCETKNLLTQKGAIYYGTGESTTEKSIAKISTNNYTVKKDESSNKTYIEIEDTKYSYYFNGVKQDLDENKIYIDKTTGSTVSIDKCEEEEYKVYKTAALNPPPIDGKKYILTITNGTLAWESTTN